MKVSINKEELRKLIDPYTINLFDDITTPITKEDIEKAITNFDIFPIKNDDNRKNHVRNIAYLVLNKESENINLDFAHKIPYTENAEDLMAAFYREDLEVVLNALNEGNVRINFNIIEEESQYIKIQRIPSWDFAEDKSEETWSNKEFILKKIESANTTSNSHQIISEIIQYMDENLWSDYDFMTTILNKKFTFFDQVIPLKHLYSDTLFDVFTKNLQRSASLFQKLYISQTPNSKGEYRYGAALKKLEEVSSYKTYEIAGSRKEQEVKDNIDKIQHIVSRFQQEVLTDKEKVLELLQQFEMYDILPENLKKDDDILSFIYRVRKNKKQYSYSYFEKSFPEDMFTDDDKVIHYIKEGLILEKNVLKHSVVYDAWINDVNKIKKYAAQSILIATSDSQKKDYGWPDMYDPFALFFEVLPKNLKNNKEVASIFIKKDPLLYFKVSPETRTIKELYNIFIENLNVKPKNVIKIPNTILESLNKDEAVLLISKLPEVLSFEAFPNEFKNDNDILVASYTAAANFTIPEKNKAEIYTNKEFVLKMMEKDYRIYPELDEKLKKDLDIACSLVKYSHSTHMVKTNIPKELWGNKRFCLETIFEFRSFSEDIPLGFWNDVDFVTKIAEKVSAGILSKDIFNKAPDKINTLLNSYEINKQDYPSFLRNYMVKISLQENIEHKAPVIKKNKI